MAFSVSEFRSAVNNSKFDGLAKSNKFYVELDAPFGVIRPYLPIIDSREMQFFCDTINLPGKNLNTLDYKKQGYGDTIRVPTSRAPETITTTFFCDSNYQVMKFFQAWLDFIVEGTDAAPSAILDGGRQHREIAYKEDYTVRMKAYTLNDSGDEEGTIGGIFGFTNPLQPGGGMEYTFHNVHPVQLGVVSMGWEQNDTILKIPVEFAYSHYETILNGSTNPRSLSQSSVNFFDRLLNIGNIAGTILNTRRPRNIQDVIDVVSSTSTILRQL